MKKFVTQENVIKEKTDVLSSVHQLRSYFSIVCLVVAVFCSALVLGLPKDNIDLRYN